MKLLLVTLLCTIGSLRSERPPLCERVANETRALNASSNVLGGAMVRMHPGWLLPSGVDAACTAELSFRGPPSVPGYDSQHSVRLVFTESEPRRRPGLLVAFISPLIHHEVNVDGQPTRPTFYDAIERSSFSLKSIFSALLRLLLPPSEPHRLRSFLSFAAFSQRRLCAIANHTRKRPELLSAEGLPGRLFHPAWRAASRYKNGSLATLVTRVAEGVYLVPLLTSSGANELAEEIEHWDVDGQLDVNSHRRDNEQIYSHDETLVNDGGFYDVISSLLRVQLQPLAAELYPMHAWQLDRHHSFTVRYGSGTSSDRGRALDPHVDDSTVTFNLNLRRGERVLQPREGYSGGGALIFCGRQGTPTHRFFQHALYHQPGVLVMHLGDHRHGAEPVTSPAGARTNLIIWAKNLLLDVLRPPPHSASELERFKREAGPPNPRCLSFTNDVDYFSYNALPANIGNDRDVEKIRARAWCPPPHARHDSAHTTSLVGEATATTTWRVRR